MGCFERFILKYESHWTTETSNLQFSSKGMFSDSNNNHYISRISVDSNLYTRLSVFHYCTDYCVIWIIVDDNIDEIALFQTESLIHFGKMTVGVELQSIQKKSNFENAFYIKLKLLTASLYLVRSAMFGGTFNLISHVGLP